MQPDLKQKSNPLHRQAHPLVVHKDAISKNALLGFLKRLNLFNHAKRLVIQAPNPGDRLNLPSIRPHHVLLSAVYARAYTAIDLLGGSEHQGTDACGVVGIEPTPDTFNPRLPLLENEPVRPQNPIGLFGVVVVDWNVCQLAPLELEESIRIVTHVVSPFGFAERLSFRLLAYSIVEYVAGCKISHGK